MRLENSEIEPILHGHTGSFVILTGQELDQLRHCFSSREFALMDSILISPILYNDVLLSVLIITESACLDAPDDILKLVFTVITETAAPTLYMGRQEFFAGLNLKTPQGGVPLTAYVRNLISSYNGSGNGPQVICLNMTGVFTALQRVIDDVDPFRLKMDLLQILSAMTETTGSVFPGKGNSIIIVSTMEQIPDLELFLHQISTSLHNVFVELPESVDLDHTVRSYPADGTSVERLLENCI